MLICVLLCFYMYFLVSVYVITVSACFCLLTCEFCALTFVHVCTYLIFGCACLCMCTPVFVGQSMSVHACELCICEMYVHMMWMWMVTKQRWEDRGLEK